MRSSPRSAARFGVRNQEGESPAHVYFENEPGPRSAHLSHHDG